MFPNPESHIWIRIIESQPNVKGFALRVLLNRLNSQLTENSADKKLLAKNLYDFFNKYQSMCKFEYKRISEQLNLELENE